MANEKNIRLTESELNAAYTAAAYRFAQAKNWREYMALADEFRALDTYKDSAQMYAKCIKAASAPAYREITEMIAQKAVSEEGLTAADFREAARIMQLIQDYQDAREVMRTYIIKANALTYEEATALVTNADATTEELGRGVELFRSIKTFKNSREMLERFEKYYFERMYAEGTALMQKGHVYSEFEEAAAIFEKITAYSDSAEQAVACRKQANKLRPKVKKTKEKPAAASSDEAVRIKGKDARAKGKADGAPAAEGETVVKPRRRRVADDETRNMVAEVWQTIDKRRMVEFILWVILLIADVYASIVIPGIEHEFIETYQNEIRGITTVIAIVGVIMGVRAFLRMLTASMRQKLGKAALRTLQKLAAPLIKAVTNLLASIGIDITRRNRLSGRDEKSIVHTEEVKVKKGRKRLKNELKWQEQPDNLARVRFIFIDYMIRRIREGYFMKRCMTPFEIGRDIAIEEDEKMLFRVYDMARYAGRNAEGEITDAMIGELKLINQKKN